MVGHPPRAFPWEQDLPWAPVRVRQSPALQPVGADRVRGFVSARGVDASTSPDAGTSVTARTPRPEPAMPRPRKRAVTAPSRRLSLLRVQRLRRRVVTRQKIFFPAVMRSAGLP